YYPTRLPELVREAPPGQWLYTGGLENQPDIVGRIAGERQLWGNDADVLARVRDPFALARTLRAADVPCPAVHRLNDDRPSGRWLVKPLGGAARAGRLFRRTRG